MIILDYLVYHLCIAINHFGAKVWRYSPITMAIRLLILLEALIIIVLFDKLKSAKILVFIYFVFTIIIILRYSVNSENRYKKLTTLFSNKNNLKTRALITLILYFLLLFFLVYNL